MNITSRAEAKPQGSKRYFTGKPCKHGHISERNSVTGKCLTCHRQRMRKSNQTKREGDYSVLCKKLKLEWISFYQSPSGKAKRREANRLYKVFIKDPVFLQQGRDASKRLRSKDGANSKQRDYYKRTIYQRRLYARQWASKNVDYAAAAKKYRDKNPAATFARSSLQRLERGFDLVRFESIFMYKLIDLTSHIESQFVAGMSWENRSEWHIDHIKPLSLFIKEGITCPAIINALSNLQPLWAKDNLAKGAKYD